MNDLNMELKSKRSLLQLSKSTLEKAQDASLLDAIQNGLLYGLEASVDKKGDISQYSVAKVKFEDAVDAKDLLGKCYIQLSTHIENDSLPESIKYIDLLSAKFELFQTAKCSFQSFRFDVIDKELWCVEWNSSKVHVFNFDSNENEILTFIEMGQFFSVLQFDALIVFAVGNGLFTVRDRKTPEKFKGGIFIDVCQHQNFLLALQYDEGRVCKFEYIHQKFQLKGSFMCKEYQNHHLNTILSDGAHAYVCLFANHVIQKYTIDGQLLQTFGSRGPSVGQLNCPLLSGIDDEGNILVAEYGNKRIDVLKTDGSWESLKIDGLEESPVCARVVGSKFFVKPQTKPMQVFKITSK